MRELCPHVCLPHEPRGHLRERAGERRCLLNGDDNSASPGGARRRGAHKGPAPAPGARPSLPLRWGGNADPVTRGHHGPSLRPRSASGSNHTLPEALPAGSQRDLGAQVTPAPRLTDGAAARPGSRGRRASALSRFASAGGADSPVPRPTAAWVATGPTLTSPAENTEGDDLAFPAGSASDYRAGTTLPRSQSWGLHFPEPPKEE